MNKVHDLKCQINDLGFSVAIEKHSFIDEAVIIIFGKLRPIVIKTEEAEQYLRHCHANDFESIYNGLKMLEIKRSRNSTKPKKT
jgi:hypothetical protein